MSPKTLRSRLALAVAIAALAGCSPSDAHDAEADSDGAADSDSAAPQPAPTCRIGELDKQGNFVPFQSGDTAELVVGFQGFMLVIVRVQAESGTLPEKSKVRMVVQRQHGEPSVSTVVRAATKLDAAGKEITEPLDMWLYPPAPGEFDGKTGSLTVELQGRTSECTATVAVKFADEELCKHSEDGSVVCVDGSKKDH